MTSDMRSSSDDLMSDLTYLTDITNNDYWFIFKNELTLYCDLIDLLTSGNWIG